VFVVAASVALPEPLDGFFAAVNAQDRAAFVAFFGEDGVVDDWGRVFTGPEAIGGWSDGEFVGKQATLEPTEVTRRGDEVVVVADVGGNGFNGPSTFTFEVDGDRVRSMKITA
jgi:ketosteroid isomerase-like protein